MNGNDSFRNLALGLAGAVAGAALGHFAFIWIARQGFYAPLLPGVLAGVGGGLLVKDRSVVRAVICGVIALAAGLFSEWRFAPFITDQSLGYFLTHIQELRPITLLMIAAGAVGGFWFSLGRGRLP
jgi:hypothetical protein